MKYRLSPIGSGIDHHPVPPPVERQLSCDPADGLEQCARHPLGHRIYVIQRRHMLPRNHQDMFRRLGMDIPEGDTNFIFINLMTS